MQDTDLSTNTGVVARDCTHGKGLFAKRRFTAGQKIADVTGTVVTNPSPEREEFYMDYGSAGFLEPAKPFRYLNHSCDPNCELEIYEPPRAAPQLTLRALRTIKPGEEIRNDYGWYATDPMPCFCGATNCRGWIVAASELDSVTASPLRMREFPREFSELLNASGRDLLASAATATAPTHTDPTHTDPTQPGNIVTLTDVISQRKARDMARLLSAKFRAIVRRETVPIADDAVSAAGPDRAAVAAGSADLYTLGLNRPHSRGVKVARAAGLMDLLHSASFRRFAEACCGLALVPQPALRLHCYEAGQFAGPRRGAAGDQRPAGQIAVQLTFCEGPVRDQLLVHESATGFSEIVHVAQSGLVNVCHLPFWHYTTPLEVSRSSPSGRRWVLVASFDIA